MKILIACLSNPNNDPRPNRIIKAFTKDENDITVFSTDEFPGTNNIILKTEKSKISKLIRLVFVKFGFYNVPLVNMVHNKILNKLIVNHYDLIICHDLMLLPLIFKIRRNAKVVFDAREYYPKQFEDQFFWRFFNQKYNVFLVKKYMRRCDRVLTVSPGLQKAYKDEFNIETSIFLSLPKETKIKATIGQDNIVRMVHHGNATPSRHIEDMIYAMKGLDNSYYLDLYLMKTNEEYYNFLVKEAEELESVNILPPVEYEKINEMLVQYDIGIFFVRPSTFNLKHCLPNKLFEFIQAGLAVCIGPSPDMAEYVNNYKVGIVAKEFSMESFALAIKKIENKGIDTFKKNSILAGKILNFQCQINELKNIIYKIGEELK